MKLLHNCPVYTSENKYVPFHLLSEKEIEMLLQSNKKEWKMVPREQEILRPRRI